MDDTRLTDLKAINSFANFSERLGQTQVNAIGEKNLVKVAGMPYTGDHMRSDMISPYGESDILTGILMVVL
jgi:hypothetical protein